MVVALALVATSIPLVAARREVPQITIDLDLAPRERYKSSGILTKFPQFNHTVWGFYDKYFAHDKVLTDALYLITDLRGKENDELQGEVQGMADISGLPLKFVQAMQLLYELQTLMVPIVNFTGHQVDTMPK